MGFFDLKIHKKIATAQTFVPGEVFLLQKNPNFSPLFWQPEFRVCFLIKNETIYLSNYISKLGLKKSSQKQNGKIVLGDRLKI